MNDFNVVHNGQMVQNQTIVDISNCSNVWHKMDQNHNNKDTKTLSIKMTFRLNVHIWNDKSEMFAHH